MDLRKRLFAGLLAALIMIGGLLAGWPTSVGTGAPVAMPTPLFSPSPSAVRVYYQDRARLQSLAARFEPWEVQADLGYAVFELPADEVARLQAAGVRVEPHTVAAQPPARLPGQTHGIPGFECYRTVQETYARAAELAVVYPHLAAWIDIGDSWNKINGLGGSDLMVLRLTNQAVPGPKPVLFLLSAIHARELATAELALRFAEHLLANYDVNPDVTWLLDHTEIQFLLQANPDGRELVEIGGTYWRKNTNQNYCTVSDWRGADLNRNFSFEWGCCGGSSTNQCEETYRGPAAASEPETQAVQSYLRSIFPDRRAADLSAPAPLDTAGIFLDIHSYSQLVIWPWGFTHLPAPNGEQLQTLGRKLAYFNGYEPGQAAGLYLTDGTTDDFVYGELGVAALTFEIGTTFYQSCASFENQVLPENLGALLYAAKAAHQPYQQPAGPEALDLALSSAIIQAGEPLTLTVVLDDSRFAQTNGTEPVQAVAGGQVYLDQPPWLPGAQLLGDLQPVDGVFDSSRETLQFTWQPANIDPGRHLLFVQGEDTAGNLGTASAVFIQVEGVQAGFTSSSPTVLGTTTVFTDTSQGAILARLWDFGDGQLTSTTAVQLEHTYQQSGRFTVTLTVTGTNSASLQQQPVFILQPWSVLLPILNSHQVGPAIHTP